MDMKYLIAILLSTFSLNAAVVDYRALSTNDFTTNGLIVRVNTNRFAPSSGAVADLWTNDLDGPYRILRPVDQTREVESISVGTNLNAANFIMQNTNPSMKFTAGIYGENIGTNSGPGSLYDSQGQYGIIGETFGNNGAALLPGDGVGVYGLADSGFKTQYGVEGVAIAQFNGQTNVGAAFSSSSNGKTGTTNVGLYVETQSGTTAPTFNQSAVITLNSKKGDPVLVGQTNNTYVFGITSNGLPQVVPGAGAGNLLTSDANGVGTWGPPQVWTNDLSFPAIRLTGDTFSPPQYYLNELSVGIPQVNVVSTNNKANAFIGAHKDYATAQATFSGLSNTYSATIYSGEGFAQLEIGWGGVYKSLIDPGQNDGDAPYVFDTLGSTISGTTHTDFRLGGTSKLQLKSNADLYWGANATIGYRPPATNGSAGQVLATDGNTPQQLSWTAAGQSIAAGTNITAVTNGSVVTVSVSNTNLPVVIAGTNITVITNGLGYTVSVQNLTNVIQNVAGTNNAGPNIGPGTVNYIPLWLAGGTNITNSVMIQEATNQIAYHSLPTGNTFTNSFTNIWYEGWTDATHNYGLKIVQNGLLCEITQFTNGSVGSQVFSGITLNGAWTINGLGTTASGGHNGDLFPKVANALVIGSSSLPVKSLTTGTAIGLHSVGSSAHPVVEAGQGIGFDSNGAYLFGSDNTTINAQLFSTGLPGWGWDMGLGGIAGGGTVGSPTTFAISKASGVWQLNTNNTGSGTASSATLQGSAGSGTDKTGGDLIVAGGPSTGTARAGSTRLQTANSATGSSSSANTLQDRTYISAKAVTLTESSATLVFNIALASGKFCGMRVMATTDADDGTDFQSVSETFSVAAVNKAGTVTTSISVSAPTATLQSSGTLTTTWTAVANGAGVDVKCNAVSSLTQTTLKTRWRVDSDGDGTLVVTPQ